MDALAPPGVAEMVLKNLEKAAAYAEEQGLDYEFFGIGPKADHRQFIDKLQSKKYDVLIIGGGIKGIPQCNETLEMAVNTVIQKSPQMRILFTANAEKILDSVQRAGRLVT